MFLSGFQIGCNKKTSRIYIFSKTIQKIVVEKSALQTNLNQRFDGRDRRIIESAMEELECGACIKFTRRTSEQSYVHILADQ